MDRIRLLLLCSFVWLCSCQGERQTADLVVVNATIWTGNNSLPMAQAMAIKDGLIVDIGTSEIASRWEAPKVLNVGGSLIVPGFIDCHVHFFQGGFALASVQLRDAKTQEEFIRRIADFAKTAEGWITGGDWDHEQWGGELPTKDWIDDATSEVPVFIRRLDGHMALANSKALELAVVNRNTPDVEGGEIVRDANGNPTGVLKDNAMGLVGDVIPAPSARSYDRALEAAMRHVSAQGVTTVHHVGATSAQIDALERAKNEDRTITRIYALTPLSQWRALEKRIEKNGRGDDWLKFGGLKGFVDGSLGSHTAAFKEPYSDQPTDRGFFINPEDSLRAWIQGADAAGLQVAVHAIGDRANTFILDAYEEAIAINGPRDRRFRIEHAQHIDPADYPRFAALGVIPSMQPYHAIDDGRWAERVIGPQRIQSTYAFRSLLEADAALAFGSDWFVAPPDPLFGIYAAVTRQTLDGANPEGWVPSQRISVEEALKAYTYGGAYASFEEQVKGRLVKGQLADFVMLSENIFEVDPQTIKDIQVLETYVGGEKVFELR